jgi:iron complex transport system substrate-binding protein
MRRSSFRQGLLAGLVLAWATVAQAACPRIISQSPYITHQLAWLGLKACIVGASRYEHAVKVPDTGGVLDPDEAAIARLRPELVITSVWTPQDRLLAATPPGARALRLASFQSMTQIEENLRQIGQTAGVPDTQTRARAFAHLWRKQATTVGGDGRRALLLSSCTGQPYSFGRNTWLADLFTTAGFVVADPTDGVRHLRGEATSADVAALIADMRPDVVFIFNRHIADSCGTVPLPPGTPLIALDGDKFLHPAPILLEGLQELKTRRAEWTKN